MGIVQKQGGISTIIIYVGILLGYINAAVILPKYFSPEIIGLRTMMVDFSTLMSTFSLFGFPSFIQRYYPHFKSEDGSMPGLLSFSLLIPTILFLVITLFLFLASDLLVSIYGDTSELFLEFFWLVLFLFFAQNLIGILNSYAKVLSIVVMPNIIKEVVLRLLLTMNMGLYIVGVIDLDWFILLFVGSYFVQVIWLMSLIWINDKSVMSRPKALNTTFFKSIISFCGFTFLASASNVLVMKIDTLMLGGMVDLDSVGIYSIAIFIATLVEVPKRAILQITSPIVSQLWYNNDTDGLRDLYHKIGVSLLLAGGYVLLILYGNISDLYRLFPNGEMYREGILAVLFLGLAKLTDMGFGMSTEFISYSEKYKYSLIFSLIFCAAGVILNYILIPLYGITGAAIASCASVLIYNLCKFIFIRKVLSLSPFKLQNVYALLWLIVNGFIIANIDIQLSPILTIILKSIIVSIVFFIGLFYLKVLPEYNQFINKWIKLIVKK